MKDHYCPNTGFISFALAKYVLSILSKCQHLNIKAIFHGNECNIGSIFGQNIANIDLQLFAGIDLQLFALI